MVGRVGVRCLCFGSPLDSFYSRCHDEFDDVAGLMAHFKDPVALDALSCEGVSQEDLVRVKQEVAKIEQSFEGVHTQTIYDHEEGPSTAATATTGDEEFKRRLQPKITIKIEGVLGSHFKRVNV